MGTRASNAQRMVRAARSVPRLSPPGGSQLPRVSGPQQVKGDKAGATPGRPSASISPTFTPVPGRIISWERWLPPATGRASLESLAGGDTDWPRLVTIGAGNHAATTSPSPSITSLSPSQTRTVRYYTWNTSHRTRFEPSWHIYGSSYSAWGGRGDECWNAQGVLKIGTKGARALLRGRQSTDKLATLVLNRSAPTPTRLRGRGVHYRAASRDMEVDDDERDAEIAEELEEEGDGEQDAEGDAVADEDEGSEADAPGEEEEEGDDDDEAEGEIVGAVKTRSARSKGKQKVEESEESDGEAEDEGDDSDDSSKSGEEEDWEAADDDAAEDVEVGNATQNRCVYVLLVSTIHLNEC